MIRLLGAGMICAASVMLLFFDKRAHQQELDLAQELGDGFEHMLTEIRWHDAHMPPAIESQIFRPQAGEYFKKISDNMRSGNTLQDSWNSAFLTLEDRELSQICCHISLNGDKKHLIASLDLGRQQITAWLAQQGQSEQEMRRIRRAAVLSAAGLGIILLL